jgi:hypothetical protein
MTHFRTTPKITRSSTSYLLAAAAAAVSLTMTILPLGMVAANAANLRPAATQNASPMHAATVVRAVAQTVTGMDHSSIAGDAVSAGDAQTVEMSIAAYDRVSVAADLATSR